MTLFIPVAQTIALGCAWRDANLPREQYNAFRTRWLNEHPVTEFYPRAIETASAGR